LVERLVQALLIAGRSHELRLRALQPGQTISATGITIGVRSSLRALEQRLIEVSSLLGVASERIGALPVEVGQLAIARILRGNARGSGILGGLRRKEVK
jgi:hypothetical protein